jgi:hypothetical protein
VEVNDHGETLLFEGSGRHAGLEIVGRLDEIVESSQRTGRSRASGLPE